MSGDIKLIKSTEGDWEQLLINGEVFAEGHELGAHEVIHSLMSFGFMDDYEFIEEEKDPDFF